MPVLVEWGNPEKTYTLFTFEGNWTWQEYHNARDKAYQLVKDCPQVVNLLIDMSLIEKGQGDKTNLIIALANATGVDFNGQMPRNPPASRYATAAEIQTIVDWLNAGLPE